MVDTLIFVDAFILNLILTNFRGACNLAYTPTLCKLVNLTDVKDSIHSTYHEKPAKFQKHKSYNKPK